MGTTDEAIATKQKTPMANYSSYEHALGERQGASVATQISEVLNLIQVLILWYWYKSALSEPN